MIPSIDKLQKINLPKGKFAIFGSAVLAIRNIRDAHDLDILVKADLWDELTRKYPDHLKHDPVRIKLGDIEIYNYWPFLADRVDEMIANAQIISNLPFVRLEYFLEWKKKMGRPKDSADIKLVEDYLSKNRPI